MKIVVHVRVSSSEHGIAPIIYHEITLLGLASLQSRVNSMTDDSVLACQLRGCAESVLRVVWA